MSDPKTAKSKEPAKSAFWLELNKFLIVFKLFPLTLKLIRPHIVSLVCTYFLSLLITSLRMLEPKYVGTIVDIVTRSKDADDLQSLATKMVVFTFVMGLVAKIHQIEYYKATQNFKNSVKAEVYKNLLNCNMAFFDKMSTSEAAEAMSSGVDTLEYLYFGQLINTLQTILNLFGSLWLMYTTSVRLSVIVLFLTPVKLILTYFSMHSNQSYYKEVGKLYGDLWSLPHQAIQNISLVKSFSTEKKEHKEFVKTQTEISKLEQGQNGGIWDFNMMINLAESILNAAIIWFGGNMAFQGTITPGELSTFNLYYSNFNGSFFSLHHSI